MATIAQRAQRQVLRVVNATHSRLYRLSSGRFGASTRGMPVLLLTVAGRKSGTPHTVPCVYLDEGGSWLVCGSAGGQPAEPQWFRNLRAATTAEVEVDGVRHAVRVEVLDGAERDAAWVRLVAAAPFFAEYQAKVDRVIPLARLTPTS